MKTLRFLNPEIQDGLNLTVRNGSKWADLECGEIIRVVKTGEETTELEPVIVIAAVEVFGPPGQYLLRYEHDPLCRTQGGLVEAMDRAYPDGWGPELTLLFFATMRG